MKRIASVIGLTPGDREEYEELHANVWPGVLDRLSRSNIRNYSIYRHGDLLFAYFEHDGENFAADVQAIADDEETQRWWSVCSPMQRPVNDREDGEWWKELPEIFHLD